MRGQLLVTTMLHGIIALLSQLLYASHVGGNIIALIPLKGNTTAYSLCAKQEYISVWLSEHSDALLNMFSTIQVLYE